VVSSGELSFRGRAAEAHARPGKDPRVTLAVVELPREGEEIAGKAAGFRLAGRVYFLFVLLIGSVSRSESRGSSSRCTSGRRRRGAEVVTHGGAFATVEISRYPRFRGGFTARRWRKVRR
jgi:hypothetical protein